MGYLGRSHRYPVAPVVCSEASTSRADNTEHCREEQEEKKCACNGSLLYASSIFSAFVGITLLVFGAMTLFPNEVREPFLIVGALLLVAAMVLMLTGIRKWTCLLASSGRGGAEKLNLRFCVILVIRLI